MFIRKAHWERTLDRIAQLEKRVRDLENDSRVYIGADGLLSSYSDSPQPIMDALNALAKQLKCKWQRLEAVRSTIETINAADPAGP